MADLKSLFAKKANPDGQGNGTDNRPDATGAVESKGVSESPSQSNPVPSAAEAESGATPKPANPFARAGSSGGNGSGGQSGGGTQASSDSPSSGGKPSTGLTNAFNRAKPRPTSSDSGRVDAPAIQSLDAFNSSTDAGVQSGERVSYFPDETPATKPTRELPEDLPKEQVGFVEMLDGIYEIMHDPELLGGVIRNIMVELGSNPEYTKLMSPEDIRAMVRGMRESMGLARVKKQESKAKRGSSKKSKALDSEMLADLNSLMSGIG